MKLKIFGSLILLKLLFFPPVAACQNGGVIVIPKGPTWNATFYCVGVTASACTPAVGNSTIPTVDLRVSPVPNVVAAITASNGVGTLTYSKKSGSFPNGMTLDSASGKVSGVITQPTQGDGSVCSAGSCTYSFTLAVTDSAGNVAQKTFNWQFQAAGGN